MFIDEMETDITIKTTNNIITTNKIATIIPTIVIKTADEVTTITTITVETVAITTIIEEITTTGVITIATVATITTTITDNNGVQIITEIGETVTVETGRLKDAATLARRKDVVEVVTVAMALREENTVWSEVTTSTT